MIVLDVETKLGKRVVLTGERWNHVVARHPAMVGCLDKVEQTLASPDLVVFKNEAYIYQKKWHEYMTVVLDEKQIFIITAFFAKYAKKGELIWKA